MGGVFVALYPSRTRAAVLMSCTASVAGERQKEEFLLMTSVAPTGYDSEAARRIGQSMRVPVRRPRRRGLKWWNSSAPRLPQPVRTPSARRPLRRRFPRSAPCPILQGEQHCSHSGHFGNCMEERLTNVRGERERPRRTIHTALCPHRLPPAVRFNKLGRQIIWFGPCGTPAGH
jgi:hypothetical protein